MFSCRRRYTGGFDVSFYDGRDRADYVCGLCIMDDCIAVDFCEEYF